MKLHNKQAFTLLELAMVLLIIGLVTAMAMTSGVSVLATARLSATEKKMQAIESALKSYRDVNDRLPCPAALQIAEGAANFGVEAATPGTCYGGTPSANVFGLGATNTIRTGVEGTIPVVTLGLPNDFMYDGWGNRIRYAVDRSFTANNAFKVLTAGCNSFSVTIKDALGNNRSTGAIYALISHGENGHGAFTKKGVQTSYSSTNTDELTNCHCSSTIAATAYAPTYVQKDATNDPASSLNVFDDIVVYKERWQMLAATEKPLACQYAYITDKNNNRVQVFTMDGLYLRKFGSTGTTDGLFSAPGPSGIAVDSSGNVYVADIGGHRIQKFNSSGTFVTKFGNSANQTGINGTTYPMGVQIDSSGNIWVGDTSLYRAVKYDSNGTFLAILGGGASCESCVSTTSCTCTSGTTNGTFGANALTDLAFDSSGNIYITDSGNRRVQKFNSSRVYQSQIGSCTTGSCTSSTANGGFQTMISGVAINSYNDIYVSDTTSHRIQKFNSSGSYLSQLGACSTGACSTGVAAGSFNIPNPIAFDASGNLWVNDFNNHRVQKFDSNGNWLLTIPSSCATSACATSSSDGQFNFPHFIAIGP